MIPDDYLEPVWRARPATLHGAGVFTVGLDPREAAFVLDRGWVNVDGVRYRATSEGCDPNVQGDGRVMVRCDHPDRESLLLPERWPDQVTA